METTSDQSRRPGAKHFPAPLELSGSQKRQLRRRGDRQRTKLKAKFRNYAVDLMKDFSENRFPGTDDKGLINIPYAGRAGYVEAAPQIQSTSHQMCGFFPFLVTGIRPILGSPLGRHYIHKTGIFLDLMMSYLAKGSSSPSLILFGLQGRGKSSIWLRMCLGMAAAGFLLVFPGDLKGEYTPLIEELGGKTIKLGAGMGYLNPLDAGPLESMIDQISDKDVREQMQAEMRSRRHSTCRALVELVLKRELIAETGEKRIFSFAIDEAVAHKGSQALLSDVVTNLENPSEDMIRTSLCESKLDFEALAKPLLHGLDDVINGPDFAGTFSQQTSEDMPVGKHVSFDISAVPLSQPVFRAGLQIVTWNYAQAVTSAVASLVKAGLWPEQHYIQAYDELWQAFQVDPRLAVFMLDDNLRISRTKGIGTALITHGTGDLNLPTKDLTEKAKKFIARSSMRIFTGIDHEEINELENVQKFTPLERAWLSAWAADSGYGGVPPGRGKFLIKFGDDPGIPVDMGEKTPFEISLHNTNQAFDQTFAAFEGAKS